jgi:alpha-glucosidase
VVVAAGGLGRGGSGAELLHPPAAALVRLNDGHQPRIGRPRSVSVTSPDGHVRFDLEVTQAGALRYRVRRDAHSVVDWSQPGMIVDGVNVTEDVRMSDVQTDATSTNSVYAVRGVHKTAADRSIGQVFRFDGGKPRAHFTIEVRAFDDGIGFRFVVPGSGARTPDEATTFTLPAGSTTWSHDLHMHYEALYVKRAIEDVPRGDWAAPPITYKLPGDGGYASITEAGLTGYAGMALQADGRNAYVARLGHAHPVSYPYALRYRAEDVMRLAKPAQITGTITTPWRVIIVGADLNRLVNNDIVHNLAPPPDPTLFPQGLETPWIKPARAVWRYLDGGDNTYEGLKRFTELAAQLGFEHHVVEGVWRQWTPEQLKAFVDHARARNVGIWLWKHSRELQTPEARAEFFELCQRNGVTGAKVDFFDHEAKEVIDLYEALLCEGARYHLMFDFHGANKPTGLDRTWPNELTREGVYGFEHRGTAPWGPHNAALPFTRLLAGGADYTPTVFGDRRRETSWAHQVATAVLFYSPLLVYGGHPQSLLDSPAADIIRGIPSTWDETIVLPTSEIGEIAIMARRKGREWFVAAANGGTARTVRVPLTFLGQGPVQATLARDDLSNAAALKMEQVTLSATDTLSFELRAGGGFAARLIP